jgi:hypothetical protein
LNSAVGAVNDTQGNTYKSKTDGTYYNNTANAFAMAIDIGGNLYCLN